MKTLRIAILAALLSLPTAQAQITVSPSGQTAAQVQALINTSTRNVQSYMDGLSGRPTYAAWNAAQTTTDVLGVLDAAAADTPNGGTLVFPGRTSKYMISDTWAIPHSIVIQGEGHSSYSVTEISPLASFPVGDDFITITGGYSAVRDISSNMQSRGGNWLTFIGEGGGNYVERNNISGVSAGYWGIELRDSGGVNGVAVTHIDDNAFSGFGGGAIWGNGGGDSVSITRNVLQLVGSTSHILKWDGLSGAAKLEFSGNNASGASKFIELNNAAQFEIIGNQFEATTAITNTASAMIVVNGPANGGSIKTNNLNGHSNVTSAIYFDSATDCLVENNSIAEVTNDIKTTANTARITYLRGIGTGTLDDTTRKVSIIYPSGPTIINFPDASTGLRFAGTTKAVRFGANSGSFVIEGVDAATGVSSYQPLTLNGSVLYIGASGSSMILDATGVHITGVTAVGNATAGDVGQYISSSVAVGSATALTTATPKTVTSISLTAGDWDVTAIGAITGASTGTVFDAAISANDNSFTGTALGDTRCETPTVSLTGADASLMIPSVRINVASTTTYYLVVQEVFTIGSPAAYGRISARRVR